MRMRPANGRVGVDLLGSPMERNSLGTSLADINAWARRTQGRGGAAFAVGEGGHRVYLKDGQGTNKGWGGHTPPPFSAE